jgi:hypothetical protein
MSEAKLSLLAQYRTLSAAAVNMAGVKSCGPSWTLRTEKGSSATTCPAVTPHIESARAALRWECMCVCVCVCVCVFWWLVVSSYHLKKVSLSRTTLDSVRSPANALR